ncbi:MAG: PilZ domain-containing protein [Candidatus Acidiferrales bacterium]
MPARRAAQAARVLIAPRYTRTRIHPTQLTRIDTPPRMFHRGTVHYPQPSKVSRAAADIPSGGDAQAKLMRWRNLLNPGNARSINTRTTPARPPAPAAASSATAATVTAAAPHQRNKRRAHRVSAFLPVFVYGRAHNEPFAEHAVTLNVSSTGGFLALDAEVSPAQKLLMANEQTDEELPCRIARVIKTEAGKTLVGFEFLSPSPRFWSIDFTS